MENKGKKIPGSDIDKAIAKAGSSKPEELKTDEPIAEKDEVKQAEEELHKRLNKKNKKQESAHEAPTEQKTTYLNKPHMLFR